ncbi:hypothetical protein MFIFM68171_02757 [Madurella fahalii]|uniref:Uncharacterized protein n=1 Tax=Madurella fahalii TaxID=1157608 RepID=A0ABQ0G450_9PEZI
MLYDFSLYDPVNDPDTNHPIQTCSPFSHDFNNMPLESVAAKLVESANVDVDFELRWLHGGLALLRLLSGHSLARFARTYIVNGHGASDDPSSCMACLGKPPSVFTSAKLCGPNHNSTRIFGVVVTSNATFSSIQSATKSWANATCLSFAGSKTFPGIATFTTPFLSSTMTNSNLTNSAVRARHNTHAKFLQTRANCRTVQVVSGDGFAEVQTGDNFAELRAEYGLTNDEREGFNKNIWGWRGCKLLFAETITCLSTAKPPFPSPIINAVCSPQKPGFRPPTDGSKIANLDPWPPERLFQHLGPVWYH